jgi:lipopolysaccharide transport system ATP-binding protein
VVDEVLAVGDAEFQKKAIGKMQDISHEQGRTVLFVSHNMAAVSTLTNISICINNGFIVKSGITQEAINYYLNENTPVQGDYSAPQSILKPNFTKICVRTSEPNNIHKNGEDLIIDIYVNMPYGIESMAVSIQIFSEHEIPAVYAYIFDSKIQILRTKGSHHLSCTLTKCKLYQGNYYLKAHLGESKGKNIFDQVDKICSFGVMMLDEIIEWGWQKDVCIYTEDFKWKF